MASYGYAYVLTRVQASIISGNTNTDVDFVSGSTNSFSSLGDNIIGDGNAATAPPFNQTGDQINVADPGLGPLANNGGPTQTHALVTGSPAIDAVTDGTCPPPATDQRGPGFTRPVDGNSSSTAECDTGAFEFGASPPLTGPGSNTEVLRPLAGLANGTGFASAGTGLFTQPGDIDITVPEGATINQVLLYWAGRGAGDDSIIVDGNVITGTLIGGPTPGANTPSSSYRGDITSLNLVQTGANSLTVEGLDFGPDPNTGIARNDGAGIIVVFDAPGQPTASIQLRDGNDFAFQPFSAPLNSTVTQTFTVAPSNAPRTAQLSLFVADAEASAADVVVINAGVGTRSRLRLIDQLTSNDGAQWDTLTRALDIPAGVSRVTVRILSTRDRTSPLRTRDSLAWVSAILRVPASAPVSPIHSKRPLAVVDTLLDKLETLLGSPGTH